jgi:hypothetical protein
MQKPKLHDHEEPQEASGAARDVEVLQYVPKAHATQGNEVNMALAAMFTLSGRHYRLEGFRFEANGKRRRMVLLHGGMQGPIAVCRSGEGSSAKIKTA